MRKVGWVVSMIWLQYAYVVTLDHCLLYIDLPDPLHIYFIHSHMYLQTHLLAKCSKVAMIVNFLYSVKNQDRHFKLRFAPPVRKREGAGASASAGAGAVSLLGADGEEESDDDDD